MPTIQLPCYHEAVLEADRDRDPHAEVVVELSGPGDRRLSVPAFWEGGRIWRFRTDADAPGHWSFRVRPDADGTPYLWLADTAWNGALKADPADWAQYLHRRREQGFTAVQCVLTNWRAFPADDHGERAYTGARDITVNPAFFRRLDARVAAIAGAGLVPVLVVLWALTPWDPGHHLEVQDAVRLGRYIVARYHAFRPVWLLGGDGRYLLDGGVERWKHIGRAVIGEGPRDERCLAGLHPCGESWIGEAFRGEPWFDFIGYRTAR